MPSCTGAVGRVWAIRAQISRCTGDLLGEEVRRATGIFLAAGMNESREGVHPDFAAYAAPALAESKILTKSVRKRLVRLLPHHVVQERPFPPVAIGIVFEVGERGDHALDDAAFEHHEGKADVPDAHE